MHENVIFCLIPHLQIFPLMLSSMQVIFNISKVVKIGLYMLLVVAIMSCLQHRHTRKSRARILCSDKFVPDHNKYEEEVK